MATGPDRTRQERIEYIAYLDTDVGRFHFSADLKLLTPVDQKDNEDEVRFRAGQLLDLFRKGIEETSQWINLMGMMSRSPDPVKAYETAVQALKDIRDDKLAPRTGARQALKVLGEE